MHRLAFARLRLVLAACRSRVPRATRATLVFAVWLFTACSDATAPSGSRPAELQLTVAPDAVSAAEVAALGEAFDRVDNYHVTVVDAQTLEPIADAVLEVAPNLSRHVLEIPVDESAFGRTVRIALIAFDGTTELYRAVSITTTGDEVGPIEVDLQIRYTGPGIRGTIRTLDGVGVGGVAVNLSVGQSIVRSVNTEPDGTYLFLDVDPGSYAVVPTPPDGVANVCPGLRQVSIESVDDAVVADFATRDDVCRIQALVVSGGDFDDTGAVAELLSNDPELSISTFFFVDRLPGVATLSQHDVVLLFMNGLFDESASLGDEVAAYVEAGGNVIVASFYWQGRSDGGQGSTGWGALESVDPFLSAGGATDQPGTLDPGSVVAHPLTTGLGALSVTADWGGAEAKSGTTVVASWADGSPLIGYRVLPAGQRIVGVTLFPASGQTALGDVQVLWENAVNWAGAAGGPAPTGSP